MSRRAAGGRPAVLDGAPLLIAHRGGAALAPENTTAAFERAAALWCADMIELDVHASADGRCVVIHDATVDRTTDGTGRVAAMTLAELRELDAGFRFSDDGGLSHPFRGAGVRIPTIDEVLETLPDMRLTVEVKAGAAQLPLLAAIERHGAVERVVAAGMYDRDRTLFARHTGAVSASSEQLRRFHVLWRLGLARWSGLGRAADVVQVPETWGRLRVVSPGSVAALHRAGVDVHVWTVNETADMARLLDWGVDGLVTDRPDRLATLLHGRLGRPLPPGCSGAA
jgi:glycerophosphoryl diester phosphodiesterase